MPGRKDAVDRDLRFRSRLLSLSKGPLPLVWPTSKRDLRQGVHKAMRVMRPPKNVAAQDVMVPREDGTQLRLLVLRAAGGAYGSTTPRDAVGVLWIHGGGYVTGAPEMAYMGMPPHMLRERPCVVVCPEYRLAGQMPFPGGLEDCHLALEWLNDNAHKLGVRADQLFVGGESAGGGLTAALCLYERDLMRSGRGGVRIACQMPLYPMLDDRPTSSSVDNSAPVWDTRLNQQAWELYLKGMDREALTPYAAPARETNFEGLPPAISFVGTLEPFLDETVAYMGALRDAGVPTDLRVFRGCYHAFDMLGDSRKGREAREFFLRRFAHACDNYTSE